MNKPYNERTDIEKIESNWRKTLNLYRKRQYSGAMVRAATVVELASNLVIREEFQNKRKLDKYLVDSFMMWANGIQGKFDRLILPALKGAPQELAIKRIKDKVGIINSERNSIVHSGQFKNEKSTNNIIHLCKEVIETLLQPYSTDFKLTDIVCK